MRIIDVRDQMPNYEDYKDDYRSTLIRGIAIHHSATAHPQTGLGIQDARTLFDFHVTERGWDRGGYHYVVHANGLVEYALDERITAYHAGFSDPEDKLGLEYGQYWNNHYLAICLVGWFDKNRVVAQGDDTRLAIPDYFTHPSAIQYRAVIQLIQELQERHHIEVTRVRGHRELEGSHTRCPGHLVDLSDLRARLAAVG